MKTLLASERTGATTTPVKKIHQRLGQRQPYRDGDLTKPGKKFKKKRTYFGVLGRGKRVSKLSKLLKLKIKTKSKKNAAVEVVRQH